MKGVTLTALKWGLVGGLAIIILQTLGLFISRMTIASVWVVAIHLPLLFCMIYGGVNIRKEQLGQWGYGKSLYAVLIIALTGSILYNLFFYRFWMVVIDPDFISSLLDLSIRELRDKQDMYHLTDEQIEQSIKVARNVNFELYAYARAVGFSLFLSLIVAAFVSRSDKAPEPVKPEA